MAKLPLVYHTPDRVNEKEGEGLEKEVLTSTARGSINHEQQTFQLFHVQGDSLPMWISMILPEKFFPQEIMQENVKTHPRIR